MKTGKRLIAAGTLILLLCGVVNIKELSGPDKSTQIGSESREWKQEELFLAGYQALYIQTEKEAYESSETESESETETDEQETGEAESETETETDEPENEPGMDNSERETGGDKAGDRIEAAGEESGADQTEDKSIDVDNNGRSGENTDSQEAVTPETGPSWNDIWGEQTSGEAGTDIEGNNPATENTSGNSSSAGAGSSSAASGSGGSSGSAGSYSSGASSSGSSSSGSSGSRYWDDEEDDVDEPDAGIGDEPIQSSARVTSASIIKGRDYEISGDYGKWTLDSKGRLWIAGGSSLYAKPVSGSGYTDGAAAKNLEKDGTFDFRLTRSDSRGQILEESDRAKEYYYIDNDAPEASVSITGNKSGNVTYASSTATVSFSIAPDAKSGLRRMGYCITEGKQAPTDTSSLKWTTCSSRDSLKISAAGFWHVLILAEDNVGNVQITDSGSICIDKTKPVISVSGVKNNSANSGKVAITVTASDEYYQEGSLIVECQGVNRGLSPSLSSREDQEQGQTIIFRNFPQNQSYDDIYILTATASDLSGNQVKRTLQFSVNRFGSVYELSQETRQALSGYYLTKAVPIEFYETNIDYVGESQIYCRLDGQLKSLIKGQDYTVEVEGDAKSWKRYHYTIPASVFNKEGVYELLLASKDKAANSSDTSMQQKQVTFVLDQTAPKCLISGAGQDEFIQADSASLGLHPTDNIEIAEMEIYRNSQLLSSYKGKDITERMELTLKEDEKWQTLQIHLTDNAGNECWTEELRLYINSQAQEAPPYIQRTKSAQEIDRKKSMYDETEWESEQESDGADIERNLSESEKESEGMALKAGNSRIWIPALFTGILVLVLAGGILLILKKKNSLF